MAKRKTVLLDMDGTIANLYGIKDWLPRLLAEDKTIFTECQPMVSEMEIYKKFPKKQYRIKICTMTPKDCSDKYHKQVIQQKNEWLDKNFPSFKERVFLHYGYDKNVAGGDILVDDSEKVRATFKGIAIYPEWLPTQTQK